MPTSKQHLRQKTNNPVKTTAAPPVCEVEFVLQCIGAERVYVCGDFNEWESPGLQMIRKPNVGLWEKRLLLPPGRHEYKFMVDGKWQHDPGARENVRNHFGSLHPVCEAGDAK